MYGLFSIKKKTYFPMCFMVVEIVSRQLVPHKWAGNRNTHLGAKNIREVFCIFPRKTSPIKMLTFTYNKISLTNGILTTELIWTVRRDFLEIIFYQAYISYMQSNFKDVCTRIIPIRNVMEMTRQSLQGKWKTEDGRWLFPHPSSQDGYLPSMRQLRD